MPDKGQILANPETGDVYEFMETAADTSGAYVKVKATVKRRGQILPNHFHTLQDETFEVVAGQLTVWLNGSTTVLKAGDKMTLPKNVPHNHFNDHETPVTYMHTAAPGLDFDYLIETLVSLAIDGKCKNGKYGFIQELVLLRYLDSKSYLAGIPLRLQKILMNTIAPAARLLGYRAVYKKYSGTEK